MPTGTHPIKPPYRRKRNSSMPKLCTTRMASPLRDTTFLPLSAFLPLPAIVSLMTRTLADYRTANFARKRVAGRHSLVKEMPGPWSEYYGNAVGKGVFYHRMHLLLRPELMSLAGLFDGISDRRIIDAVLPVVAPGYRRVSLISESIMQSKC